MDHPMTLNVPERVYQSLVERAHEAGQEPESLALQILATATTRSGADDPVEVFIGAFRSQASDWADQHDAYLR
jgi:hypothetical protein